MDLLPVEILLRIDYFLDVISRCKFRTIAKTRLPPIIDQKILAAAVVELQLICGRQSLAISLIPCVICRKIGGLHQTCNPTLLQKFLGLVWVAKIDSGYFKNSDLQKIVTQWIAYKKVLEISQIIDMEIEIINHYRYI